MHGGRHTHLKPVTPMRGPNRPKEAHSHPQRRHRFHAPRQPHPQRRRRFHAPHQPHPQRRRRFHQRPTNTTDSTTTRPNTARHETHDTNARRPTLALETRDTNARLHPPKTGPFTPAKATPVSCAAPTTPAKATPVSQASQPHCHLELRPAHSHLSLTGSGRHPREVGTLADKLACFTRVSRSPTHPGTDTANTTALTATPPSPSKTGEAENRSDGRSVRVGGARREEWGHGR